MLKVETQQETGPNHPTGSGKPKPMHINGMQMETQHLLTTVGNINCQIKVMLCYTINND